MGLPQRFEAWDVMNEHEVRLPCGLQKGPGSTEEHKVTTNKHGHSEENIGDIWRHGKKIKKHIEKPCEGR